MREKKLIEKIYSINSFLNKTFKSASFVMVKQTEHAYHFTLTIDGNDLKIAIRNYDFDAHYINSVMTWIHTLLSNSLLRHELLKTE